MLQFSHSMGLRMLLKNSNYSSRTTTPLRVTIQFFQKSTGSFHMSSNWRTNRRTRQSFNRVRLETENSLVLGNKERIGIWDTGFTTRSRQPGHFFGIEKGGERIGH